ncbi:hypothetical protein Fot_24174 [Forsythia ovata]|uniref:Uncharacterized protein n=1 Tax=Forsythia ovata TaxID=205694 RepID=A0ABD1U5H2_9LAMI
MPAPSGPSVLANSPPIADVPYSASLTSSQLNVPASEQPLPLADDSRTHTPAPQAPSGASNQQAIGGVPGSVGLPLNQISESSKSLDPIAEDPSDANWAVSSGPNKNCPLGTLDHTIITNVT